MLTWMKNLLASWGVPGVLGLAIMLSGCQGATATTAPIVTEEPTLAPAVDLPTVLAALAESPGWTGSEPIRLFDRSNLYDLMNGQSDAFFVYGFEQVGVQRYMHESAPDIVVMAAVFQVNTPASAYGLYTANSAGDPLEVGVAGRGTPGVRLSFWQSRYYVQLTALEPLSPDVLDAAARALSSALPAGGSIPEIMTRLPQSGSEERFFHEELSIQDMVWLGGENVLSLGQDTEGALARYELTGGNGWLVLITYPDVARAEAAFEALKSGELSDLAAYRQLDRTLGAVFGPVDRSAADQLLNQAFQP